MAWLVHQPSFIRLLMVELWLSFIYAGYNGAMVVHLTEIVPVAVRTAGFSLAYSLATTIGGSTPAIVTYLIHETGNRAMPVHGCQCRGDCLFQCVFSRPRNADITRESTCVNDRRPGPLAFILGIILRIGSSRRRPQARADDPAARRRRAHRSLRRRRKRPARVPSGTGKEHHRSGRLESREGDPDASGLCEAAGRALRARTQQVVCGHRDGWRSEDTRWDHARGPATRPTCRSCGCDRLRPRSKYLYVGSGGGDANKESGDLTVFSAATGAQVAAIVTDAHAGGSIVGKHGRHLYVLVPEKAEVVVLDRKTHARAAKWTIPGIQKNVALDLDEKNHRLFLVCAPLRALSCSMRIRAPWRVHPDRGDARRPFL